MFIQTETTPNPQTLKFLPNRPVLEQSTRFYTSLAMAEESPLAMSLFHIQGVNAVFLGSDFVTITKDASFDWSLLKADILTLLMDFFIAGHPILHERTTPAPSTSTKTALEDATELEKEIIELIDTRVRPSVAMDGGDIIFHSFKEGVVYLELHGSCAGCPSSTLTLKQGIENMLKHYVPEVLSVEAV
jgi:NFU1 iron-sulfur cluster scaffold homolog, mitochondrial